MTAQNQTLEALTIELTHRAQRGEPEPPCAGDDRFTSESADERREVVDLCSPCPIRTPCAAASRRMTHGIWAGVDKSTPSVTKTSTTRRKDTAA